MAYEIEVKRPYEDAANLPNTYRIEHLAEAKAFIAQVMDMVEYAEFATVITIEKIVDEEKTETP